MAAGHRNYLLRGGVSDADFPSCNINLKDLRDVGRIAWEKWGGLAADRSPRELVALAYAEGLYHGAMIATRDHPTIGSSPNSVSSVAVSASSSKTTATETPSVRDLLDSL